MKTNYKFEHFAKNNVALRIAASELDKPDPVKIKEKNNITYNDKIKEDISIAFAMIHTKNNNEKVIDSLNNILTYAKDNFFYDNFLYEDIQLIINFSLHIFNNDQERKVSEMKEEEEEEEELIDEETIKSQQNDISTIAGEILPLILGQPDITKIFIENSGLYHISESMDTNLKCIILSLASIAKISKYYRDEVFGFEFYTIFLEKITYRPLTIIDFEAACKMAESLVEFEMSYQEQNQCAKEIFYNLYELEEEYCYPEFLDAARKLLQHVAWSEKYGEENQIFNIFPLFSVEYQLNQQNTIGQYNDKPIIPFIASQVDVKHHNDKNELWFEKSANYLYSWIFFIFFENKDQAFIQEINQLYDLNPIWHILLVILDNNIFRDAIEIASSALTLLVQIDINNFIDEQYYEAIVYQFPNSRVKIKAKLLAVITISFTKVTNEQMLELVNQPDILDLVFDTLYSIDLNNMYISDIIYGLYRFIEFCGFSPEGMVAFRNLVLENEDFERWTEQLIEYTSNLPEDSETQDLIYQANQLNSIIHQRIKEYNDAMQNQ